MTASHTGAPNIQNVADKAGVSRAAVSKVIRNAYGVSPAMRERVNAAIKELNYRPSAAARALRGSSFTIGMELPALGNPFFSKVIAGATRALESTPYQLILAPAANEGIEGLRAIQALADRQVGGLIAISPLVEPEWLEQLAHRTPLVMLGRHDQSAVYDSVTGDDIAGTRQVMRHLLALGHTRIAHLTIRDEATASELASPHALRLGEYERIVLSSGANPEVIRIGTSDSDARAAMRALLRNADRPTAIFAGNDALALGALWAREELGLTPGEVSIVGYDDIEIASHPALSLTTVDQSGEEMGERAVNLLLERLGGRTGAVHHQINPVLQIRSSTAPRSAGNIW